MSKVLNWVNSPQIFTIFTFLELPKEGKARRKFAWQCDIVTDEEFIGLVNLNHASRQTRICSYDFHLKAFLFKKHVKQNFLFMAASFFIAFTRPVKGSSTLRIVQKWLLSTEQMSCPCRSLGQIHSDSRW